MGFSPRRQSLVKREWARMTVGEVIERCRRAVLVGVLLVLLTLLGIHIATPAVYYVEEAGLVRVHVKATGEWYELVCPRFQVSTENMTLSGPYAARKSKVTGKFVYVLMRGVRAVGPVTVEVSTLDGPESAMVTIESRDHPLVPNAFIHDAHSLVKRTVPGGGWDLAFEVRWSGSVDSPNPPLESVTCNGQPVPSRLTDLGPI